MSYTLNGVSYTSPTVGQRSWGANVTAILDALGAYTLVVDGGTRSLLSELDLGTSYGIKVAVVKSQDAAPAAAGIIRLGNAEVVGWRNQADGADLALTASSSDRLTFDAVNVPTISSTDVFSNKTLTLPQINDTSSDHQYIFAVSELVADRTVTLPLLTGNDEFTFNDHAATLTNKTVTALTTSAATIRWKPALSTRSYATVSLRRACFVARRYTQTGPTDYPVCRHRSFPRAL